MYNKKGMVVDSYGKGTLKTEFYDFSVTTSSCWSNFGVNLLP